jgi:hypothetical protein
MFIVPKLAKTMRQTSSALVVLRMIRVMDALPEHKAKLHLLLDERNYLLNREYDLYHDWLRRVDEVFAASKTHPEIFVEVKNEIVIECFNIAKQMNYN